MKKWTSTRNLKDTYKSKCTNNFKIEIKKERNLAIEVEEELYYRNLKYNLKPMFEFIFKNKIYF